MTLARRLAPLCLLAAFAAACGSSTRRGPVDVMVLVYDGAAGSYVPTKVTLTTPTDVDAMSGPVAHILGGARISATSTGLVTGDPGHAVHLDFLEDGNGTLVPADFHSLNVATTYYNFERSFRFFEHLGQLTPDVLGTPTVYYWVNYSQNGIDLKDNAAFVPALPGFLVAPFESLQGIPLAINTGVIGHEFSHSVFNFRVHHALSLDELVQRWGLEDRLKAALPTPGFNLLRSMDEGIADLFGAAITCRDDLTGCDTAFLDQSLPPRLASERRFDVPTSPYSCLSPGLLEHLIDDGYADFHKAGHEYHVGSVLAASLWSAASHVSPFDGPDGSLARMLKVVFDAEQSAGGLPGFDTLLDDSGADQTRFALTSANGAATGVLDLIVSRASDDAMKRALCSAFLDHIGILATDLPSCPALGHGPSVECVRPK